MTVTIAEPVVLIRPTLTAGCQVIYVSARGARVVVGRNLSDEMAKDRARRWADAFDCEVKVESA